MKLQETAMVNITSDLNDISVPLLWFRYFQNLYTSSSHDSWHSRITSKLYTKITKLLIVNLLQVTTAFCTIFVLTMVEHICFIIASHMTPCFAASSALCTKLWSWRIHMDSSKNQNGLHDFVPTQGPTLRKTASLEVSSRKKYLHLSSEKPSSYRIFRQV